MRGKDRLSTKVVAVIRITPAYAGKSTESAAGNFLFGDHPRVCGEKAEALPEGVPVEGSPPRMRGKEMASGQWWEYFRITPAYAGKS